MNPLPHWLAHDVPDPHECGAGARAKAGQVTRTLTPPEHGTLRLAGRFGEALVCVRYRRDASGLRRYTTVELVVEEVVMSGPAVNQRLFAVEVHRHEHALRTALGNRGGRRQPGTQTWHVRGWVVKKLGLIDRARPVRPDAAIRPAADGQG